MPSVVSPVLTPPAKLSKSGGESINSLDREARGPQVAGGNKLQVADVLFPFLLMKSVLPKTNLFFFFFFSHTLGW